MTPDGAGPADPIPGGTVVVAGSGESLSRIVPGRVLAADPVVRVNNFVFERERYLGSRVDLAYVAGDPRLAPFVFEAMAQARDQYRICAWAGLTAPVRRAGRARLGRHGVAERDTTLRDPEARALLARLEAEHQASPTAGVRAALWAWEAGAAAILLAGIDLYAGPVRYAYEPGPRQRALLGSDLGRRGYDRGQHDPELDRRILAWLAARPGLNLWRSADVPALDGLLDLAPARPGPAMPVLDKRPITDWPAWAGPYPIQLLRALRWTRSLQRRLWPGPRA
jgi:hypothetical protein